ncbi:hypothetical protein DFP72DRAFT_757427, partial [Ephemerocybe angulata]
LRTKWTSGIYGFFDPEPKLEFIDGRVCHVFTCANPMCKARTSGGNHQTRRYQDTTDMNSTGNLCTHINNCWGGAALHHAKEAKDSAEVREMLGKTGGVYTEESIVLAFARKGKGIVTYSTKPHTKAETRLRPFNIVRDRGFLSLMKTGRPQHWIPSPSTVIRDTKLSFVKTRARIAQLLRDHPGSLHFATDCWTSPNHKAFVAFTVHLERDGVPFSMLLDFVELPKSHSGKNLAEAF